MKRIFYIAAFAMFISACNNTPAPGNTNDSIAGKTTAAATLVFNTKDFKNELTPGCDTCPRVTASIPIAEGDATIAQNINDAVFAVVQSVLGEEGKQFSSYDSLLANFMNMYKQTKAAMQHAPAGWEGNIKGSVVNQTGNFINIKLEAFTFTGGAHPATNAYSLLFNAATGNKLTLNDVVKDIAGLTTLAENKFRQQLKIPANTPINSTVYTFDNNRFVLPQNIFFTNRGLVLHYNAYEIAPYYVGATILTLPYTDVQQYLAVRLQ